MSAVVVWILIVVGLAVLLVIGYLKQRREVDGRWADKSEWRKYQKPRRESRWFPPSL
ncbi:hypothetical protein SAMN05421678_12059 [Actinopolymorpha cephalotaxi]|uniref:Uncharacterized protein n=1 Tax=Actinopolymorpha cephalotaxi TaxID=504797 RepID=A0A1I3ASG2_9ACTN|nr:hypothetical protein [Actinopolymorpha cephalotaxi]NYH86046.1 hypothetical protein [Actinopolymorpha cephalotaxi]SFH53015.1 hypothetical protein SAMN05421678_12059 [Actinopolymorpha cephalotaxi]